MLWNFVPKLHFAELQTMQLGAFMSALQFNDGTNGVLLVLNYLNLRIGSHMLGGLTLIEKERIHDSKKHSLKTAKTQLKKFSAQRKKKCLQNESKEGFTYHPGAF
ncbi:hypothetical protein AVEN_192276-1 [Araneus ventricosus]|uniref:Uncharacterized protein n=1 Tax=Araneus ventricosus TaxID=182803 RepID=A0A4Y2NRX9_ARAVE|nr:hypothetical protein AVEN_192276-1 [Araneus ventricosus]